MNKLLASADATMGSAIGQTADACRRRSSDLTLTVFQGIPPTPPVAARDAQAKAWETCGTAETQGAVASRQGGAGKTAPPQFQKRFVGSKGGAGVAQQIISQMPPHTLYVEAFAGTGRILLTKRPAASSIAIDNDPATCDQLRCSIGRDGDKAGVIVICDDAVSWLEDNRGDFNQRTVVYCDPPYLFSTRRSGRRQYYDREQGNEWTHKPLLDVLGRLACQGINVLLSGYRSEFYDEMLSHWRRVDYGTSTRGGGVTESLWCSFEAPTRLHDYRFLGSNFRERDRIKRKKKRWLSKLKRLSPIEAAAIITALDEWRETL